MKAQMGVSLSWETDGRMPMRTAELMDSIFMNEAELKMYQHQGLVTEAWIKSSKHDVTVVVTLGDAGAEAYLGGQRFFCKARGWVNVVDRTGGGDAFDAGFLEAWLDQSALEHAWNGLRSAALVLGQIGSQYRNDT